MGKLLVIGLAGLFILGVIIGVVFKDGILTGRTVESDENLGNYTYTSAVCSENKCVDVLIECSDGEVIDLELISDVKEFSSDWVDNRRKKDFCE